MATISPLRRVAIALGLAASVPLAWSLPVLAADGGATRATDHPLTAADAEAFFDGLLAGQMRRYHVPGAAVAVVRDGQVLLAKGYGYADLEARSPVDGASTLFRIGSVSKLFTWTAVMQLVEDGLLDLDRDVNEYLDGAPFRVPPAFGQAVTLSHLMNHTAGFEDRAAGLFSHDAADVRPLGEVLARVLPRRVRPPGEVVAYSNHGAALAGYLVERVSGQPWETYVEEQILEPLGMEHTTARQPMPPRLADHLAVGYVYDAALARFERQGFEYLPVAPAGSISASAADMARFMLAHLQLGHLGGATILRPETAQAMQRTSHVQHPRLGGIAHGFLEQPYGTLRTIGHGGDTPLFHAELRLIPSHGVGIFVAYNAPEGAKARDEAILAFLDRYFGSYADWPGTSATVRPDEVPAGPGTGDARRFAGVYKPTRAPRSTLDRLLELLTATTVRPDPLDEAGSSLLVTFGGMPGVRRFRQLEPGIFQEVDGPGRIAFAPGAAAGVEQGGDGSGRDRLLMGSAWMGERLAWYEAPPFQIGVAAACFALFLSAVMGWGASGVSAWWRARRARRGLRGWNGGHVGSRGPRMARWTVGLIAALFSGVISSLLVVLQDPMSLAFGVPTGVRAALGIALAAALASPAAAVAAVTAWRRRFFPVTGLMHLALVAAAAAVFTLWLHWWNLLGFRFW